MEVHVESMESKWSLRLITKIGNISWNASGVHLESMELCGICEVHLESMGEDKVHG
jgi:hypothetical protein